VKSRTRTLNVRIPAGVTHGRQIRLAGQGAPGINGGHAGDLYLEVEISPHRLFTSDGKDIHLKLPIAPWEAALGGSVSVPTLGGTVNLKVPPGSQTGQRLRLKGRGLPGDPPGDELVILEIVTPPATTDAAAPAPKAKADDEPFTPPPGWRTKQRGKFTIYCRKQSEKGTRLPTEVCYDEEGIRAMLLAQREDQERVDQMRRVCGSQAACGSN
jgi:DnaJ-class molecular chaperone